jgi:hypothetical protein
MLDDFDEGSYVRVGARHDGKGGYHMCGEARYMGIPNWEILGMDI